MTLPGDLSQQILQRAKAAQANPRRFTARYRDDPIGFARDILGLRRKAQQPEAFFPNDCGLWTKQQAILQAAATPGVRRIAAKSGHGVSKSHTLAVLIAWWHLCREGRVVSTGPTRIHIEDVLWPELHQIVLGAAVHLPGQPLDKLNWKQDAYWYATGVTTDQPGAFMGRHHPFLLVPIDEAADVNDQIHLEAATCASGENNLMVLVGNPTRTSGKFYDAFKQPEVWIAFTISCLEHPNVLTGHEIIRGGISRRQVEEWRTEWGEQHPNWYSRVLGEFPLISEKGVIALLWVERAKDDAQRVKAWEKARQDRLPIVAGMDVARSGLAKCVFTVRQGDAVLEIVAWQHTNTMETTGRMIQLGKQHGISALAIDADGLGGPVVDRLLELDGEQKLPFTVLGFHAGARAWRNRAYINRRAELWFHLRHRFERQRLWLPPQHPHIARLVGDLIAPEWKPASSGRTKVESKEDLMDRGVKSTDFADSLMMSFAFDPDPEQDLVPSPDATGRDPAVIREMVKAQTADDPECVGGLPAGF